MRIGILTLPLHTNYGGILQAYALQTVLERMGHEVFVIDTPNYKTSPSIITFFKRIVKRLLGRKVVIFQEKRFNREYPIISQNVQPFIDKYIHRREISFFSDISENEFDAFVVGSDQVWRAIYFPCMYETTMSNAYLDFAKTWKIKRIAYAASFGTDEWEYTPTQTKECAKLLQLFDAVSVRELSTVELCRKYFGVEAKHVLDPTMLLTKDDYVKLFDNISISRNNGTLLNYILDETPDKQELIEYISHDKRLKSFRVNSLVEDWNAPIEKRIQPSVEQWLKGFFEAEFVITDSFHACVFSIIFNKPFVVIANKERGIARFKTLLSIFGIEDRIILTIKDYRNIKEWPDLQKILVNYQDFSYKYLVNNLK